MTEIDAEMQKNMIEGMASMLGHSVAGYLISNKLPDGQHELASIVRHVADMLDCDKPNFGQVAAIMNELYAWNKARIEVLKQEI
jgi:hypothetical protein